MQENIETFIDQGLVSKSAAVKLRQFVELFMAYSAHTNLSAIKNEDDIWQKHVVDSLMLLKFEICEGRILDIGTGGGLPGIPLAIVRPDLQVTLLDSVNKKAKACDYFISELALPNVEVVCARAETVATSNHYKKQFDVVVSRATAYLPTILTWSKPFMKSDGATMLYKTPSAEELADGALAAERLKLKLTNSHEYLSEDQRRRLIVYKNQ